MVLMPLIYCSGVIGIVELEIFNNFSFKLCFFFRLCENYYTLIIIEGFFKAVDV